MIISIVSANGGTGKTTSAANIGIFLAKMGKKTVLIDNNTGFRSLDIALGLESVFAYDISDAFSNKSKTDDVLVECNEENLFLVPASLSGNSDEFNEEIFREIIDGLKNDFEYIVIDCQSGINDSVKCSVSLSDEVIVTVLPSVSSVRQTETLLAQFDGLTSANLRLLINKIYPKLGECMSADDVLDKLGRNLLGILPYDTEILLSFDNAPVAEKESSIFSQAYLNITKRLLGEKVPITDFTGKKSFWKEIFGK